MFSATIGCTSTNQNICLHSVCTIVPCSLSLFLFYLIKIGIWLIGVKDFVTIHHGHQIFCVGEVDDVVGVTREHDDRLNLFTTYLIVHHFVCAFFTELDKSVTRNNDKLFPLGVMPMLTFSDTGLRDVDAYLATVEGMNQLCERSTWSTFIFKSKIALSLGKYDKKVL